MSRYQLLPFLLIICIDHSFQLKLGSNENATHSAEILQCHWNRIGGMTRVRPSTNISQPSFINITFEHLLVVELSDKENEMLVEAFISQKWFDHRLVWDPQQYGGIKTVFGDAKKMWTPEFLHIFRRDDDYSLSENEILKIRHDGQVTWDIQMKLQAECLSDFSFFPFDTQICTVFLEQQLLDRRLVKMKIAEDVDSENEEQKQNLTCQAAHLGWKIKACTAKILTYMYIGVQTEAVHITIALERIGKFHYYVVILPSVIIVLITAFLFLISHESDQRFITACCLLFANTFLSIIVQQLLPIGVGKVPIVASYLMYGLVLLVITTTVSIATYNIHYKDISLQQVPNLLKKVFFNNIIRKATFVLTIPISIENKVWNERTETSGGQHSSSESTENNQQFRTNTLGPNISKTLEDISKHLGVLALPQEKNTSQNEWKQLALILDRLCFYIFFLLNIIITSSIYTKNNYNDNLANLII